MDSARSRTEGDGPNQRARSPVDALCIRASYSTRCSSRERSASVVRNFVRSSNCRCMASRRASAWSRELLNRMRKPTGGAHPALGPAWLAATVANAQSRARSLSGAGPAEVEDGPLERRAPRPWRLRAGSPRAPCPCRSPWAARHRRLSSCLFSLLAAAVWPWRLRAVAGACHRTSPSRRRRAGGRR